MYICDCKKKDRIYLEGCITFDVKAREFRHQSTFTPLCVSRKINYCPMCGRKLEELNSEK